MFIDMIPKVYDSERVEQIIGQDGMEQLVGINQVMDDDTVMNDLRKGTYNVTVTIGPNYQTARQEALATLIDAAEVMPQVAQFAPDLLVKNIDSPDAQEMARRLRIPLIWQQIIQPTEEEKKTLPPKPNDPTKQLEQSLLQAKVRDMAARAVNTEGRAQTNPIEAQHLIYKTAGAHLGNLKIAHEMGNDAAAAQAEQQAASADLQQQQQQGQQDLQQQDQQHQQDIMQQGQQHQVDLGQQMQAHAADMAREEQKHTRAMARAHELHQQKLKHTDELHAKKLEQAKALAAAKPKKKAA
jgi:hypothetical protein